MDNLPNTTSQKILTNNLSNDTAQNKTQIDSIPSIQNKKSNPTRFILFFILIILFIGCGIGMGIGFFLHVNEKQKQNSKIELKQTPSVPTVTLSPTITNTPSPITIDTQIPTIIRSVSAFLNNNVATIGSCIVFPADNPWNQDISKLPINPLSNEYINSIGANKNLHPDFGGASSGNSWGIPFMTVTNVQQKYPINFTAYGSESDPGPYPIPLTAPIEGGSSSDGDRHVLVINTETCMLYEMYRAFPTQNGWNADSGAVFDLKSNNLRPAGWTSSDAAGLPIFPGLVKYDEVAKGMVNHAIRFTTRNTQRAYIFPARHFASNSTDPHLPPMGLRVRLKSNYTIDNLPPQAKIIATAMKKYGLLLADNGGDWFFQGDVNPLWDDADINSLKSIPGSAFEAVDTGPLIH
jgi:hypothetical protein